MRHSFHPEAQTEFRFAIDYYEEREKTLGYQFAAEVYAAIERAIAHPGCGHLLKGAFAAVLFVGSRIELCTITTRAMPNC